MNELETLVQSIKSLTELEDEVFNDDAMKQLLDNVSQQFSPEVVNQSVNQIVQNLEQQGVNKQEARDAVNALVDMANSNLPGIRKYLLILSWKRQMKSLRKHLLSIIHMLLNFL